MTAGIPIGTVMARTCTVLTDALDVDGTFAWNDTTLVVMTVTGGDAIYPDVTRPGLDLVFKHQDAERYAV